MSKKDIGYTSTMKINTCNKTANINVKKLLV